MKTVNRSIALVKPKQAYVDWANSLDEEGRIHSAAFFRKDCTVYLIDEVEEEGDEAKVIRRIHPTIFEEELAAWMIEESVWPAKRDFETFREWFEVEIHSIVIDLGRKAFEVEEY